jgi:hypothetical protein
LLSQVGRAITKWGAIEKSSILLSQYWNSSNKPLYILEDFCYRKSSFDSPDGEVKVYPPPPVATGPGLDRPIHAPIHHPQVRNH